MKKLFVSALAMLAVALGFTACSSEDEFVKETPAQGKKVTVIATTEEPAQRTALGDWDSDKKEFKVVWSAGDEITVGGKVFELTEGATTSTGTFVLKTDEEKPAAGPCTAYYPSTYDGSTWPAAQTYVAGNIPLGVPMKATDISVDGSGAIPPISFKNVGGILRLNLKGTAKVKSITISATNLTKPITLNCGEAVQLNSETATPFHIAVKAADYSGLKIEITNDAGLVCTKTLKSGNTITVQRSKITDITLTAGSFAPAGSTGSAIATINSVETPVKWVQLWEGGPKFAEYNVGATSKTDAGTYYMTFADAIKTGSDYVWGANWRTPSKEDMNELLLAATKTQSEKVNCEYIQEAGKWGFKFTGKGNYAVNSLFIPATNGSPNQFEGDAYLWSGTANGSNAYEMYLCMDIAGYGWSSAWYGNIHQANPLRVRPVLDETPKTKGAAEVKSEAGIEGNKVNWVQLWKNGPKFAEFNVGATSATEYGGYYAWGGNQNKVDDHNTGTVDLSGDDDTATKLWGDKWCMPTTEDLKALLNNQNCTFTLTTQNGVYGLLCQGKEGTAYASNSVFLPAAGYYRNGGDSGQGDCGVYWSSTPNGSDRAYDLYFDSSKKCEGNYYRTDGFSVRAVLNEK